MDDISKRLKEKAKQDRIKLIAGASIMAIVILAVLYGTGITVGNLMEAVNIVALAVVALFAGAVLLLLRLVKKMEADSFDEGMHIVMESVPMVCSLLNKDSSIVYCNDQAPKLLDLTSKQEYMSRFFELMPEYQPDGSLTKEKAGQVMKAAFGTGRYVFEWERKKPNGELLPLEVTLVRLSFQGEDHLLEFTRDVSEAHENKKKEQALKAKMQAILDASPLVCAVFNEEGKIEEVNREAENMFALPDRQIFVDRYHEFLPEFQPDGTRSTDKDQQVLKAVMQKGSYRHEQTYRLRDGTLVPSEEIVQSLMVDGKRILITYIRDLREYYKTREKEARMQQNVQNMIEQLNANVAEQASAVTESAAAIEEMIANIQSVTSALSKNAVNVQELTEASEVGHSGLNEVVADIREIARESESLLEINSVMQNIASQTNLLSMNAAIEAAHAGDSGRGFAVVANEIRKLAESSSARSKTISAVLKTIKASIDKITKSTDNVLNKFDAIESGVKTVAEQENTILSAMVEQKHGSNQVLQGIAQLSDITQRVKYDAQEMVNKQQTAISES